MVGLGRPGVDLDRVAEGDHQELDALVFHNLEVNRTLERSGIMKMIKMTKID